MHIGKTVAITTVLAVTFLTIPAARASSAVGQTPAPAQKVSDDTIESQIEDAFEKDSVLAPRDLDVESNDGVVTLSGAVLTAADKARAARLAKVAGVTRVVNEIEVDPNAARSKTATAAKKTKEGLNKAVDATVTGIEKAKEGVAKGVGEGGKAVGKAAGKTADAVGTAGDEVTDASLTTRVKTELSGESLLKNTSIDVSTDNKVVTLKGTVPTEAAKARAGEIAAKTGGVSRVVNDLVVRNK